MTATVLEERHMISIILHLYRNEGCTKTELYQSVSQNPRMPTKLDTLESAGLLKQDAPDGSRAVRITLTDLGRSVASKLAEIDAMMS